MSGSETSTRAVLDHMMVSRSEGFGQLYILCIFPVAKGACHAIQRNQKNGIIE